MISSAVASVRQRPVRLPAMARGRQERSDNPRGARREVPAIIDKVLRAGEGKILRRLKRIADQVNSIEDDFVAKSDAELRALTDEYRATARRR